MTTTKDDGATGLADKTKENYLAQLDMALDDDRMAVFDPGDTGKVEEENLEAALLVATRLGRCRLYGIPLHDEDVSNGHYKVRFTLPLLTAGACVKAMAVRLRKTIDRVERLHEEVAQASATTTAAEDVPMIGLDLLDTRHELWLAAQAIAEAVAWSKRVHDVNAARVEVHLEQISLLFSTLDDALRQTKAMDVLALTLRVDPTYLDGLRLGLTPNGSPPWWLSGDVESHAKTLPAEAAPTDAAASTDETPAGSFGG